MDIPTYDLWYKDKVIIKSQVVPKGRCQYSIKKVLELQPWIESQNLRNFQCKGAGLEKKTFDQQGSRAYLRLRVVFQVSLASLSDLIFLPTAHYLTLPTFFGPFHRPLLSTQKGEICNLWGGEAKWVNKLLLSRFSAASQTSVEAYNTFIKYWYEKESSTFKSSLSKQ